MSEEFTIFLIVIKVKDFCHKGKITPAEYEKITGQPYDG